MENNIFENLFIFEMANNHQGSVKHGIEIIHAMGKIARENGIKAAVKLQYRDLATILHPDIKNDPTNKQAKRFLDTKLTDEQFLTLVKEIKKENMLAMCTPFDEKSVDLCVKHKIDILKIASCSCLDWPLMEAAAKAQNPIIISTGGIATEDIDKIYNFSLHRNLNFALLHCVSIYPAPVELLHLSFIQRMCQRYRNINIGYSGHEEPDDCIPAMLSVACGAKIFERHVGIACNESQLNAYSSSPEQVERWVKSILSAQLMCGNTFGDKIIAVDEQQSLHSLMRGVYANHDLHKGQLLTKDKVFFALPCEKNQITSGEFKENILCENDYTKNAPITEKIKESSSAKMRGYIHRIKAMLNEANITVGDNFELEISHHYGVENYGEYGVAIISIVNRQYCKKLLIVLPNQKHPLHLHKRKEETFQVLYGNLDVHLEANDLHLQTGELLTVLPNQYHNFSSLNGCVFEEISTTHYKDDSYYFDEEISRKDPMERKTILKEW